MDIYGKYYLNDSLGGTDSSDFIDGLQGNDIISGNGGDDVIYGGPDSPIYAGYTDDDFIVGDAEGQAGNDRITGGFGNDIIYGDDNSGRSNAGGNDIIYGGKGNDQIIGGSGNDKLYGGDDDDVIYGDFELFDSGDDIIDGGMGNDQMIGGFGNDTYFVNSSGDAVIESAIPGNDVVYASINYTLPENVEVLNLASPTANVGTGNGLDNYIYGNTGDNAIAGQAGNDWLVGGLGNDYIGGGAGFDTAGYSEYNFVYNVSLTSNGSVSVTASEGTDLLTGMERIHFSNNAYYDIYTGDGNSNSLTANPNVLSLLYGGGGNDTLKGSIYDDILSGSSGNDVLIGGNGSDSLTGGTGADKFRFNYKTEGIDLIKDFNRSESDKIQIVKSSFGATSLSQFSYNSTTGALFFGSTQLATLENKPSGFSVQSDVVLI
ncbi:MAG TPA: calcium-binding protein [Crinalium sp.]|jgi:Ca2+-binding RTX toxin-like protein